MQHLPWVFPSFCSLFCSSVLILVVNFWSFLATLLQSPREDGHFSFFKLLWHFAFCMMFLLALATECQEHIIERIVYTRDQLIALCRSALLPVARPEVPKEL